MGKYYSWFRFDLKIRRIRSRSVWFNDFIDVESGWNEIWKNCRWCYLV